MGPRDDFDFMVTYMILMKKKHQPPRFPHLNAISSTLIISHWPIFVSPNVAIGYRVFVNVSLFSDISLAILEKIYRLTLTITFSFSLDLCVKWRRLSVSSKSILIYWTTNNQWAITLLIFIHHCIKTKRETEREGKKKIRLIKSNHEIHFRIDFDELNGSFSSPFRFLSIFYIIKCAISALKPWCQILSIDPSILFPPFSIVILIDLELFQSNYTVYI